MSNQQPWTRAELGEAVLVEDMHAEAERFTGSVTMKLHYWQGKLQRIQVEKAKDLSREASPGREFRLDGKRL